MKRNILIRVLIVTILGVVFTGCTTRGEQPAGGTIDLDSALVHAGARSVTLPTGTNVSLTDSITANGIALASPPGWRFRDGSFAATPDATLEFESNDGRVTGAVEIAATDIDVTTVARTLLLTELWSRDGLRVANSDRSPLVFAAVHDRSPDLSVVTVLRQLDGAIVSFGARVRDFSERDLYVLYEIAMQAQPTDEGILRRDTVGGRFTIDTELEELEWLGDVDGGGIVLYEPATGASAVASILDPRVLPELDGVTAGVRSDEAESATPEAIGGTAWRYTVTTEGWLRDPFHLFQHTDGVPRWLLSRGDVAFSETGGQELRRILAAVAQVDRQVAVSEPDEPTESNDAAQFGPPVAAFLSVTGDSGAVGEQIETLLNDTIDTSLRLSPSLEVADTRSITISDLPNEEGDRRALLLSRVNGLTPTWVIASEVVPPSDVVTATGELPVVRVTIVRASTGDTVTIEKQLESVFGIFPLIDEVNRSIGSALGSEVTEFGQLSIVTTGDESSLVVEVDGQPLPPGRLQFERFPVGDYQLRVTQRGRGGRRVVLEREVSIPPEGTVTIELPNSGIDEETEEQLRELSLAARSAISSGNDSDLAWTQLSALELIAALPVTGPEKRRVYREVIPPPEGRNLYPVGDRLRSQQLIREFAPLPGGQTAVTFGGLLSTYLSPQYYSQDYPTLPEGFVTVDGQIEDDILLFPVQATTRPDSFWRYNHGRLPLHVTVYQDSEYRYLMFRWRSSAPRNLRWYISTESFGGGQGIAFRGEGETPVRQISSNYTEGRSGEDAIIVDDPRQNAESAIVAFAGRSMEVAIPRSIMLGTELHMRFFGSAEGSGELRRSADRPHVWDW